jgi:hypothetical protein
MTRKDKVGKLNDPKDADRLMQAWEEYWTKRTATVKCDNCDQFIEFRVLGVEAWEHRCSCGKYNGTMRGL